jgi:hypothetical protein
MRVRSAGTYWLTAQSESLGAFSAEVRVDLAEREVRQGVVLNLDLAGSIAGVVLDQEDRPVRGASVEFSLVGGRDVGFAVTEETGEFVARSMSGGGEYSCVVRPQRGSQLVFPPLPGTELPRVFVRDGTHEVTGVRLEVSSAVLSIAGRVETPDGAPLADIQVAAVTKGRAEWDDGRDITSTVTGIDGAFVLAGLVPGKYDLKARSQYGAVVEEKQVAAGKADVRFVLPAPAAIEGDVVGFGAEFEVTAGPGGLRPRIKGTSFRFEALPPGRYIVSANSVAAGDTQAVEVAGGETKRLTLQSSGEARVDGRALDHATRQPIQDARCHWHVLGADREETYFGAHSLMDVRSDHEGRFSLVVPARKRLSISCYPQDWATQETVDPRVTLEPGGRAEVEVLFLTRRTTGETGYLGISHESASGETIILEVVADGPAARAGILKGDVILEVDGTSVAGWDDGTVRFLITDHRPGETVTVKVRRGTEVLTIEVALGKRPER